MYCCLRPCNGEWNECQTTLKIMRHCLLKIESSSSKMTADNLTSSSKVKSGSVLHIRATYLPCLCHLPFFPIFHSCFMPCGCVWVVVQSEYIWFVYHSKTSDMEAAILEVLISFTSRLLLVIISSLRMRISPDNTDNKSGLVLSMHVLKNKGLVLVLTPQITH
jgi:hypothetical protein